MTTDEQEQQRLLEQLTQWTTGKGFEGTSQDAVKQQHIEHYGSFVRSHLRVDWPMISSLLLSSQEVDLVCAICGSDTLEHSRLLLGDDDNGKNKAREWCQSPGECCFTRWGRPVPHVAHRECYLAGYLDSLLEVNGMMMSRDLVRQNPSWIETSRLLETFELSQETTDDGTAVVVCRLKNQPTQCLFCESMGLSDETLEEMRNLGFRAKEESPVIMLGLQQSGFFSPFPVGGTIQVRPCFSRRDTATILEHAVVGTFVDFAGYRAQDLRVVLGDNSDDGDSNKRLQKLEHEDYYGKVPAEVVKMHGVLKLLHWPPQLIPTLQYLYLPGSERNDSISPNDGTLSLFGPTHPRDNANVPVPPLTSDDPLYEVLWNQKQWVDALPVSIQDAPAPTNPYHNSNRSDSDIEESRRGWKTAVSNGIQKELDSLMSPSGSVSSSQLRYLISGLENLFAPKLICMGGCSQYQVPGSFNTLWDGISPPTWDGAAKAAFAMYARLSVQFVQEERLSRTVQVFLADGMRPQDGAEAFQENLSLGKPMTGPYTAMVVPSAECCRMGYSYLNYVLSIAPPSMDTMYALELAEPTYSCQKYIVVDPSRINQERGGGLYLSHEYVLSDDSTRRMNEMDAEALLVLQKAADRTQTNLATVNLNSSDDFCVAADSEQKQSQTLKDTNPPVCERCGVSIPSSVALQSLNHAKARASWVARFPSRLKRRKGGN